MTATASPQVRISRECQRLGRSQFVKRCLSLLGGGEEDAEFLVTLGGAHAIQLLGAGLPAPQAYWLRVWAARGLLWAGPGDDIGPLRPALSDESWRVREMTCKVVARYRIGDLLADLEALRFDPSERVRAAAHRALIRIVEALA